ncbi:MAG: transporter substrate-binding domain-containing protein [Gammaproteobacteria bacterium]|nr:transporter substrate-binding domain-containing protein [Gammaproteobacteria bacterium]
MKLTVQQRRIRITAILFLLIGLYQVNAYAGQTITYAWAESMASDKRGLYPIQLLKLALQKSGAEYQTKPSKRDMPQWRTLRHVELGIDLDVVWTFTTPEREANLLPIRIPIDRGLLGWRLLLVDEKNSKLFSLLKDAEQLKKLRAGQGHDWPDYPILQSNGFLVSPSSSYAGLFQMLKLNRIQYFPRAVSEIDIEIAARPEMGLAVAPKWILFYPAPLYFFVKKDKHELAKSIEKGLRMAIQDGSMRQLFLLHFGDVIRHAGFANREVIRLQNPLLTKATPIDQRDLWFSPERGF